MMKNYIKLLQFILFVALMLHGPEIFAQSKNIIKGVVTDKTTGETLIGVSVAETDKTNRYINGTVTNQNGEFVLRVSDVTNRLSFQYMGYKTVVEEIYGRSSIEVKLETESKLLEEVVVTAQTMINTGNMSINQRDMATAVSRIDAKELEDIAATSIDEALQGRLSGVDIVANSGDPGAGMSIRIRGTTSIGLNSDPMIVIDNIPYDTKVDKDFNFATADEEKYSQLINIPTEDIKEITVLKDAASAAQYGSKAANGVIVITTKRGTKGKPKVSFTTKNTLSIQPEGIPLLNGDQYAMMIRESTLNPKGKTNILANRKEFNYDPSDPYYYYHFSQNSDWVGAVTQVGKTTENNLSVSGGGDKASYRFALGDLYQEGTTIGTSLNRISTSIKLDYFVSDKIRFNADFSYTHSTRMSNPENVRDVAIKKMPNMSIYERDSAGNVTDVYFTPISSFQNSFNPVAMANLAYQNEIAERIIPTFGLKYNVLKSVTLSFNVNFDIQSNKTHAFVPQAALGDLWTDKDVNKAGDEDIDKNSIYTASNLFWTPDLGKNHELKLQLQATTNETRKSGYSSVVPNQASAYLTDPSIYANIHNASLESSSSKDRSARQLLNVHYSLLDRYIIQGSLSRDGSSKFGKNARYGYFPAIAARWRVSGEPFMRKFTFLEDFSLRADIGTVGNSPGSSFTFTNNYKSYGFDYLGLTGIYPTNMELTNLRWEKTTSYNLGTNLIMWKGALVVDFELYRKRTTDMLSSNLSNASTSGFSTIEEQNVGTMDNQGWELSINTQIVRSKIWDVTLNMNFSRNRNIIREIADNYPAAKGTGEKADYLQLLQEGRPLGSFYGYRYLGVYKDNDAAIAKDINGKPIIGPDGRPRQMVYNYPNRVDATLSTYQEFLGGDAMYDDIDHNGNINRMDIVYLGDSNPFLTGGFGPRVTYKKLLSVSLFFNFRYGNDIINKAKYNTENMRGSDNQSTAVLRRWRNPGDITDVPRALYNYGNNDLASSRFVEDGSFLRLRTVTISYSLPKTLLQKLKIESCKAYLTANNLLTFTNYSGQDPEVSIGGSDPFKVGVDNSKTPRTKDITLGLSFSF